MALRESGNQQLRIVFFSTKDAICGLQYHQRSASESSCPFGLEGDTLDWREGVRYLGGVDRDEQNEQWMIIFSLNHEQQDGG